MLIAAVFIFFSVKIDRQIENNIHERIEEYAAQQKTYISTVLESRYAMLNAFSTYFGEKLLTDTPEFDRLAKTLLVAGDFDHVLTIAKDAFDNLNRARLPELAALEDETDTMKKELTSSHFARLAEGGCSMEVSPYYSSTVAGLERVADHLVNVGYSIVNPIGSQE